jgi:hypothetical protein
MSRAFVKEDDGDRGGPQFRLPPPDDPEFAAAAARALLEGARLGMTDRAEEATGRRWGDPALRSHVERIRQQAEEDGDERLETVARRYLRASSG